MRSKSQRHRPYGLLKRLPVLEFPWDSISMDFVEKLPPSSGYNTILIIVDWLTKQSILIPTVKYWDSNSMGDEGGHQGRIGVNSNDFLQRRTTGVSTPDLMVTEFQMGYRQMDLASACVLHPLNRLVLYFKMRGVTG